MVPVKTVTVYNDPPKFESECAKLILDGYVMVSSNCSCDNTCENESYQAIFNLGVPQNTKEAEKTANNTERDEMWLCRLISGNCSKQFLRDGKYICDCKHRQKSPVS